MHTDTNSVQKRNNNKVNKIQHTIEHCAIRLQCEKNSICQSTTFQQWLGTSFVRSFVPSCLSQSIIGRCPLHIGAQTIKHSCTRRGCFSWCCVRGYPASPAYFLPKDLRQERFAMQTQARIILGHVNTAIRDLITICLKMCIFGMLYADSKFSEMIQRPDCYNRWIRLSKYTASVDNESADVLFITCAHQT